MHKIIVVLLLGLTAFSSCTTVYFESPAPAEGTELSAFPAELHGEYAEIEPVSESESIIEDNLVVISGGKADIVKTDGTIEHTFDLNKESKLLQLGDFYYLNTKEDDEQQYFTTIQIKAEDTQLEVWAFVTEGGMKLPRKLRKKLKAMENEGNYLATDNTAAFIEALKAEGLLIKVSVLERVNN